MSDKKIVVNMIRTPDGTILQSKHRHDYVEYVDDNGYRYMVDGGLEYLRRNVHKEAPYEELSLYEDDNFEEIRKYHCRGGRGKDGTEQLKWVPLCEMSDAWLRACIEFNGSHHLSGAVTNKMYEKELEYRKEHGIIIED